MGRALFFFFFFNDTATTEIYTLSLHDALPISLFRASVIADTSTFLAAASSFEQPESAATPKMLSIEARETMKIFLIPVYCTRKWLCLQQLSLTKELEMASRLCGKIPSGSFSCSL